MDRARRSNRTIINQKIDPLLFCHLYPEGNNLISPQYSFQIHLSEGATRSTRRQGRHTEKIIHIPLLLLVWSTLEISLERCDPPSLFIHQFQLDIYKFNQALPRRKPIGPSSPTIFSPPTLHPYQIIYGKGATPLLLEILEML